MLYHIFYSNKIKYLTEWLLASGTRLISNRMGSLGKRKNICHLTIIYIIEYKY